MPRTRKTTDSTKLKLVPKEQPPITALSLGLKWDDKENPALDLCLGETSILMNHQTATAIGLQILAFADRMRNWPKVKEKFDIDIKTYFEAFA